MAAASPPAEPVRFTEGLATDLERSPGLVGVYLHGSVCLGGWNATSSDVDLLIVVEDGIGREMLEAVSRQVLHHARDCPGKGIECSIVTRGAAGAVRDGWTYLAHINAPENTIPGIFPPPTQSDPDLLMHYAVCREAGIAIRGPQPRDLFAPVPRQTVLAYLADEMAWGLEHGGSAYALLNACRARAYLEHDAIVSKIAGGEAALAHGDGPLDEISAALDAQHGRRAPLPLTDTSRAYIMSVADRLRAAAVGQCP